MKTKICGKCKIEKDLNAFSKNKNFKYNRAFLCKICMKEYHIQRNKRYPWKKTLENIKSRCNNPKVLGYNDYGLKGIQCLITENELKFLWFRDRAFEMKRPSIDRINNDGHYCLENCQYIELEDNIRKDKMKPILQFNKQNSFIKEWESAKEVERKLLIDHGSLGKCCQGIYKTTGGFIWRFKQ